MYHQGLPTGTAELGESRLRCLEKSFCAGPKPSIDWPEHQPTIWSKISNLCTECFCHWGGQCVLGPQIGDVWPLCCDARGSYYAITRPHMTVQCSKCASFASVICKLTTGGIGAHDCGPHNRRRGFSPILLDACYVLEDMRHTHRFSVCGNLSAG